MYIYIQCIYFFSRFWVPGGHLQLRDDQVTNSWCHWWKLCPLWNLQKSLMANPQSRHFPIQFGLFHGRNIARIQEYTANPFLIGNIWILRERFVGWTHPSEGLTLQVVAGFFHVDLKCRLIYFEYIIYIYRLDLPFTQDSIVANKGLAWDSRSPKNM